MVDASAVLLPAYAGRTCLVQLLRLANHVDEGLAGGKTSGYPSAPAHTKLVPFSDRSQRHA